MRRPIQVLVYPVRLVGSEWEYLLLHRKPDREAFWQGVTGAPFPAESLIAAAQRELLEETQLSPLRLESIRYWYSIPVAPRWQHLYAVNTRYIREYVFMAQVAEKEPTLDGREHDIYKWCLFKQAQSLLFWPKNRTALERCQIFLHNRWNKY